MKTLTKILGPPGTGKTTTLLTILDDLLVSGIAKSEVAFIAFTRKAANEIISRACEKFNLTADELPYFRTLHSLAFQQLGKKRQEIMGINDYKTIADALGIFVTFKFVAEDGMIAGMAKGDRMLFHENLYRAACREPREHYDTFMHDEDIMFEEFEQLCKTINGYKAEFRKIDFTDMIGEFVASEYQPPIRALIVDEAQDLSPVQWRMIEKLASSEFVEHVYVAGDDDQAIFRWAGADVDHLINLKSDTLKILPLSYRVPKRVQEIAEGVIQKVNVRAPKTWEPRGEDGTVEYVTQLEQIDMSSGTWLLLGRNTYLLGQFNEYCMREGFVFDSQIGSPIKGKSLKAIVTWENLRKGNNIKMHEAKALYEFLGTRVGVTYGFKSRIEERPDNETTNMHELKLSYGLIADGIWHTALDKLTDEEREYFLAALKRGEKLLKEPRIKISTIHGAKGGEADNVVICTDMAWRTYKEMQVNEDDEHRVWYVACTRARQNLYIMQPTTQAHYAF